MTLYTWDEAKRISNLRKHGLDFADAPAVFGGNTHTLEDRRYHYNERRYMTLGVSHGIEVAIIHTEHHYGIRIISFRKANKKERIALFRATR